MTGLAHRLCGRTEALRHRNRRHSFGAHRRSAHQPKYTFADIEANCADAIRVC